MKFMKISVCLILFAFLGLTACNNSQENNVREQAREALPATNATAETPSPITGAANSGVLHYTCPNNCVGSGGAAAGTCPVCGTAYVHNQEFHNTPAATTDATATPDKYVPPGAPSDPNPAQNADGVWHYTCANGCEGGGGSPGACSKCGGDLAHNQAYH